MRSWVYYAVPHLVIWKFICNYQTPYRNVLWINVYTSLSSLWLKMDSSWNPDELGDSHPTCQSDDPLPEKSVMTERGHQWGCFRKGQCYWTSQVHMPVHSSTLVFWYQRYHNHLSFAFFVVKRLPYKFSLLVIHMPEGSLITSRGS